MLLQEFWNDRFWPYCVDNLRESTWVGYESAWRLHVMPVFGGMDLGAISVELVDKWLARFDEPGAARKHGQSYAPCSGRRYAGTCWTWTSRDVTSGCLNAAVTSRGC
ncbi:MAG: N-terminal phage integrase SAM-like domain-containing protein [Bifidobacterium bifidum]